MSQDFTEHAKLSPSGSKGWFACAGKLVMEASFPNVSGPHSDAGTAMHSVAARCLEDGEDPGTFVGQLIDVNYKTEPWRSVKFTEDMAELVTGYVTSLLKIAGGRPIMVEQRVDFSRFVGMPNQFGTLDSGIHFVEAGELFIGDLKTGHTPVEVEDNSQLLIYALGQIEKMRDEDLATDIADPFAYAAALGIKTIRLAIYQPRVITGGWAEWTCSLDYLRTFADLLCRKATETVGAEQMVGKLTPDEWQAIYLNPKPNDRDCAFCRAWQRAPACASTWRRRWGLTSPRSSSVASMRR